MRKANFRVGLWAVTAALAIVGLSATTASAQNPFVINGVVTDAANSKNSGAAQKDTDPNSNAKELGPAQGSTTKFPVIDTAVPDMLDTTNPNPSTDLNTVYTDTERAANGDIWFYFGWARDSNNGSGFISFEAHQEPNTCASYSTADLHQCNPFSPRTNGDFTIFWDQSGNSTNVYLRIWNGTTFQPGQPGLLLNTLKDSSGNPVVFAQYSSDFFRGELALNLTGAGLIGPNECQAFANVIPGTITGNSQGDQADYKDVVLAPISINTCGAITVTKVTLDPAGTAKVDTTTNFNYTITNSGAALNGNGDTSISRSITGCTGTPTCAGPVINHPDLIASANYTLSESSPPSPYQLVSIVCGGTNVTAAGSKFVVPEAGSVACVITNQIPRTTPAETTFQTGRAQIRDSITITGIQAGAANASSATVTFRLFSDNTCSTLVGQEGPVGLTYGGNGTTATASMSGAGIEINPGTTYYWTVAYTGDAFNNPFTSTCGQETGSVTFTFTGQGQ